MPELPEIEHLVGQLRPAVTGRVVAEVVAQRPVLLNVPAREAGDRLRGPLRSAARRGKEAVLSGDRASAWLHLGLHGEVRLCPAPEAAAVAAAIVFDDGTALTLDKVFMGHLHVLLPAEAEARWQAYAPDPLDAAFGLDTLRAALMARPKAALKAVLTDQACLAGIGNAYADEMLLLAHLHPTRRAGTLGDEELRRLYDTLGTVLRQAVAAGGEEGYVGLDGAPGRYRLRVHRQARCGVCGSATTELRLGGRVTTVCPECQPAP